MSFGDKPKTCMTDFQLTVNVTAGASQVLATTITKLTHFEPGERSGGMPGYIAILVVLIFCGLFGEKYNVAPLLAFLYIYITMAVIWQVRAVYRHKTGKPPVHSRYDGTSYLQLLLPKWKETNVKKIEPFIVILLGVAILKINVPFGVYLIAAGLGLGLTVGIGELIALKKLLDDIDARLEQEQHAANLKKAFGE